MKKLALMMAVFLGFAASPLLAHGGGPHLKGTVVAISADEIKVKGVDGDESTAKITATTKFVRGKEPGKKDELKQGDRVVVHTRKKGNALEAVEVRYGATQKNAP
jgi:hypothetical protein